MVFMFRIILVLLVLVLLLSIGAASAVMQKSTLAWPVAAPTQVTADESTYLASGWWVSSPFGWRSSVNAPDQYELHEGIDLVGPTFCHGCPIPPLGDVTVTAVGWDDPWADDPLTAGAGVVVDMAMTHQDEAGDLQVRYGHLQPYHVHVRAQSCQQDVDCPDYQRDGAASLSVSCVGPTVTTGRSRGQVSYAYATSGPCTASVTWPEDYAPEGDLEITFDQQITPGVVSHNAAITFRAQIPPPPPPLTPTVTLPVVGGMP